MTIKTGGIAALIIIILGGVAYAVFMKDRAAPKQPSLSYEWVLTEQGERDGVPETQVAIALNGGMQVIGTYPGSCSEQAGDLLPDEKSKVVCWFASGGKEIGLFEEGGKVVIKAGDLDEGTAESAGFRGNFQVVKTI